MASVFLRNKRPARFPVPLLALERYAEMASSGVPCAEAALAVLSGECGVARPSEDDVAYFAERLGQAAGAPKPADGSRSGRAPRKTLGSGLHEALDSMSLDLLLLAATGNDFARAEWLYCVADRDVAMDVVEGHLKLRMAEQAYLYECVLYGFGGHYEGDKPMDPANTLDLTRDDVDPIAVLDSWFKGGG